MIIKLVKTLYVLVCAVLIVQLTGCGTLMYPERRGQTSGRIDAGVAVLNGIGLFFFIIPGIIAYAIDFSSGTIYLPGTDTSFLDIKDIEQVKFDPKHYTNATMEKIIEEKTGYAVKLDHDNMEVYKLKSLNDMMAHFAEVLPGIQNTRIVLNIE